MKFQIWFLDRKQVWGFEKHDLLLKTVYLYSAPAKGKSS